MSDIEAIAGLIPIHLHLQKISGRFHLRAHFLPPNYIIKSILEVRSSNNIEPYWLLLERLIPSQWKIIKDPLADIDNRFNKVFSFFFPFNYKLSLGNRLIDTFSNQFSFYSLNRKSKHSVKSHLLKLNNITLYTSSDPYLVVIVTDTSIKNQVAILIAHIYIHNRPVIKTVYHAVNVMTTEAELFVIRYSINQATYFSNIKCIFVIMNSIYAAKKMLDLLSHLYQIQSIAISSKFREFFQK